MPCKDRGDGTERAAGWECDRSELLVWPEEPFVTDDRCTLRLDSGTAELIDGDEGFVLGLWYPEYMPGL